MESVNKKRMIDIATAALIGASAGVVAGLLLAPNSGKKTIQKVSKKVTDLTNLTKKKAKEASDKVAESYNNALVSTTNTAKNMVHNVKEKLEQTEQSLEDRLEALQGKAST